MIEDVVQGVAQVLGPGLVTGASDDDPSGIGAVDIVFFAVKLWDTEGAAQQVQA